MQNFSTHWVFRQVFEHFYDCTNDNIYNINNTHNEDKMTDIDYEIQSDIFEWSL